MMRKLRKVGLDVTAVAIAAAPRDRDRDAPKGPLVLTLPNPRGGFGSFGVRGALPHGQPPAAQRSGPLAAQPERDLALHLVEPGGDQRKEGVWNEEHTEGRIDGSYEWPCLHPFRGHSTHRETGRGGVCNTE